jgi:hypothetical protein
VADSAAKGVEQRCRQDGGERGHPPGVLADQVAGVGPGDGQGTRHGPGDDLGRAAVALASEADANEAPEVLLV